MATLKTIQDVRDLKWAGNHHFDSGRFRAVDDFILENRGDRGVCREAMEIASRNGMGVDEKVSDEQLDEYLSEIRVYRAG